ncbi:TMV resistance protein N-like [Gastrolobium bilobum]|uniref:TMV resistance protein N-like n=1 Tax=Gastrolobium bilobum TaxID=150636 RepID=UPI002AB068BD|nr:TMV resistance protein N-like [Gastrolobium bilobum]
MANLNHDATSSDIFFYDVFLSFRGELGSRYGFTDHLYNALRQKGIYTFRDDEELKIGAEIRPALMKAIENSRMLMVVLCQNYASSTWCLDELAKIVDCHDNKGKQVLVIFYKVEPSDVWNQKNSYEAAMIEHENRFGQDSDMVQAWRKALSRVRDLTGEHCKDNMYEPELINKIVKDASAKLPPLPLPIKHVVGLDSRFEQVKSSIDIESRDTVCMLEIYGGGGIGKTTFALDMYNKIRHHFEAASFLDNVREKSNKSTKGLEDLQKTLLSEMGEETETMMGSTFQGGFEIKRRLGRKRVLLILDDVDSVKQLESLAGGGDWFGSGSRIIITTRDKTMIDKHVIDDVIIKKYKMEELNDDDSLELFCWHAFNMSGPAENYAGVSSRAVNYAKGVPLALKVIGSNLKGGSLEDWEMELDKYKNIPNAEIQGVLEISYNSLSELDQKTFLDIASFFKGERWEYVKRLLKACDFFPIIRVFVSKCLIIIDENGCLEMHDLIQDMGREIVRKESPLNPGDRSRIWYHKEVLQVLTENSGSSRVEGIMLDPPSHEEVNRWIDTAFEKMKNLRILIVRNTEFSTGPSYLPNSLRLVDWKGYPSQSLPPNFYPHRIVDFKLPHSSLMFKKPFQIFEDLTFINLSQCQSITHIPDVSGAINLRVLTLDRCHKVVGFDKSFGFMPNLVSLSASECNMLKSFVPEMYLPSLEVLSFNFCRRLESFPHVMQKMDKPLRIRLVNTAIKELPKSIRNLAGLENVDMSICTRLKDLSSSFLLLPKLVTLTLDGCSQVGESFKRFKERHSVANGCPSLTTLNLSEANLSDDHLYAIFENFPKLEDLNVSYNDFVSLPKCIKGSLHLKNLDVSYCRNLRVIPELPLNIQKVEARYCGSLTTKASSLLWSKVFGEKERIQVVMPKAEIPNLFDFVSNEEIPLFWARRKFPVIALAFMFGEVRENEEIQTQTQTDIVSELLPGIMSDKSHVVGLHLFIDGQEISRKDYHYCSVGEHHVLLCDLSVLFNDEERQGLDACVGDEWKAVQVQIESWLNLSRWGVYVYKEKTNTEDIRFSLPKSNSSGDNYMPIPPTGLVPKRTPGMSKQRIRYVSENLSPREIFGEYLPLLDLEETPSFTKALVRSWRNTRADIKGEASASSSASASAYGASLMQEHEQSGWDVVRVAELMKENMPKHIADVFSSADMQSAHRIIEEFLKARVEFIKEKGHDRLDIDMPIILEACHHHSDEAPSRRYWGKLQIKHGVPTFKAVLRKTSQLAWRFLNKDTSQERMNIVLLRCQPTSTGEASSSSHGESLEEGYYDPVLEELLSTIEEDAMRLNKSYGNLKASIVLTHDMVSDKYLMETLFLRGHENVAQGNSGLGNFELGLLGLGMLGLGMSGLGGLQSNFKKTPYGKLRVE